MLALRPLPCLTQSQTIDSLRTILPLRSTTARVAVLNRLCYAFLLAEQKDSAMQFADQAYDLASRLSDAHGLAVYYCNRAQIAKHFDDDFRKAEDLA
ncbi:MAG TPA: hypothetical protein VFL47_12040, partial [Flavisolibacter sp.]|nr:hypothetical protein [Flavisolibacter sp.]